MELRLPFQAPLNPDSLFGHLAATAVPGVEEWRGGAYRRTLRLPGGPGVATLRPEPDHVGCRLVVKDEADLPGAVERCRWLLDLDAGPAAVDGRLGADPLLAPLVAAHPGRRVPRTVDAAELAIRAVLGQQVSTAAAATHAGRLVRAFGEPVDDPGGGLTHLFPTPAALVGLDPATLALPLARRRAVVGLVTALATGAVDLTGDLTTARAELLALPGLGPWTVEVIAMRGLGDPDAFPATDLGVRFAAAALGLAATPGALVRRSAAWSPFRSYAVQYLWATGTHAVNRLPET